MLWMLSGHQGLPVGFRLLWQSVLFTVESLSLLYLLFISWCICSRRWCMDTLGVLYANQRSMCLDPHLNWVRLAPWNWFKPSSKNIFTDRSKAVFLLWIICSMFVMRLACSSMRGVFYVRWVVGLIKTAKANAYIMYIFGKIELLSIHTT